MNWKQWHHLYLGLAWVAIWLVVAFIAVLKHNLTWILIAIGNMAIGLYVAGDDVAQHKWNWNTPGRRFIVFMWRFAWVRRLTGFFDRIFKGERS